MTTWKWLKQGRRWETSGVICGRVSLKALQRTIALAVERAHFTDERITTPDYPSRVIKAVLPNSIITHLEGKRQEEMEKEEEEAQLSSHPLCYCELGDRFSGFQGLLHQVLLGRSLKLRADLVHKKQHLHTRENVFMYQHTHRRTVWPESTHSRWFSVRSLYRKWADICINGVSRWGGRTGSYMGRCKSSQQQLAPKKKTSNASLTSW